MIAFSKQTLLALNVLWSMQVVNYLLIYFHGQTWCCIFYKTSFLSVPSCFLKKELIKLFKAEPRDNTTSHLIYTFMVMALQGNVMSLCAGPNQDSKYYPFTSERRLVSSGLSQQRIYKAKQAHDLDSHEPPSPNWISHWMGVLTTLGSDGCTAPEWLEVTPRLFSHSFTFTAAEVNQSPLAHIFLSAVQSLLK